MISETNTDRARKALSAAGATSSEAALLEVQYGRAVFVVPAVYGRGRASEPTRFEGDPNDPQSLAACVRDFLNEYRRRARLSPRQNPGARAAAAERRAHSRAVRIATILAGMYSRSDAREALDRRHRRALRAVSTFARIAHDWELMHPDAGSHAGCEYCNPPEIGDQKLIEKLRRVGL